MYYVYIITCSDDSYYTGYTPDVCHRLRMHSRGSGCKYTHAHPPKALAALWRCPDDTSARRLEYAIKHRLSRPQKESLVAQPETVAALFPHLAQYDYQPVPGVSLEDCTEGHFSG